MSNLKTVTLNGVTSTSAVPELKIRRVERDLLGEDRTTRVDVPGRAGAWAFTEEPGNRTVRVVGWLQAEGVSNKRAAIHKLAVWLADAHDEVALIVDDESDRYYKVTAAEWDVDTAERHPTVVIEFEASAYAYSTSASTQAAAASGTPDSDTFTVTDDFEAEPVIEITPTNGTITGFVLTLNGDTVEWSGPDTLLSGETITISSLSDTVSMGVNVDVNLTGAFDPADAEQGITSVSVSGFPLLIPGSNSWTLSWTGTATTVDIDFTWRERFI